VTRGLVLGCRVSGLDRKSFDDLLWIAVVERLGVLVEGGEVLDVVLGLVERVRDAVVDVLPALEHL
jgi:hypothetical protein